MKKFLKNCLICAALLLALAAVVCIFAWKGVKNSLKPPVAEIEATETQASEGKDELTLWFENSDNKLKTIGKNIEDVINEIYLTNEKYAGELKAAKDKTGKNSELLKAAEEIKGKARGVTWPQVLQQWVLKNEEELDKKIAEINSSIIELKASEADKAALVKEAEEKLAAVKGKQAEFVKVSNDFQMFWDKVKLQKMSGSSLTNIQEEIDQKRTSIDQFITESKEIKK